MTERTGGEAVVAALRALGVTRVFGIVSVHNIPIFDAILRDGTIEPIAVRHEQAAVHAADGYARASGRLGVAIASTGPGTTNAMTGLFEAAAASSPVLLITGQVDTIWYGKGKGFLHEAESQLPMLRTVCRRAESVRRTEAIARTIIEVARDILDGRPQPGAVEIPIDLQYRRGAVVVPPFDRPAPQRPDPEPLERALALLRETRRRVLWAGGGSIDASAPLRQLAERLGAPVFTTVNGRGVISEDHPLAMGPLTAHPAMQAVFEGADLLVAVGTRFQGGATRNWSLPLSMPIVHIDADPSVIGRNYPAAAAVVADARVALEALLERLDAPANDAAFTAAAVAARDAARSQIREDIGPDHAAIMDAIRELLPRDAVIVRDATIPAYLWGNRLLPILEPRTSIYPASAAIGPGLPLAIGAAAAGRRAAVIQGDGGLMLSVGELATLAQYRLPVILCVFNDHGYGVLRSIQARTFEGRTIGVDLATPDFAALARAMGIRGERVGSAVAFRDAFAAAVAEGAPALIEIDADALTPMRSFPQPPRPRG
ncbi:Acetolactate synthase isozyme 2 large subunit [bacterium HR29]|jgi:acetolactate synthase-1/2/3 large subunit|nr:Acetolactate synthase isozyme 2 large subunit [bacterium HR29]